MKLIADSGSTKTDWCVAEGGRELYRITTQGTNPFYQTTEEIEQIVMRNLLPRISNRRFAEIWFYGAGYAFPQQTKMIREILCKHLPGAQIGAGSDMLAAARALCGRQPGIACIMGTGSNSCYYDGKEITANVPPLGFLLGDEGSGAVLGRLLVGDYLKKQLPEPLRKAFSQTYEMQQAEIMDRVYKKPFPNRFLAGFTPFLSKHIGEPCIHRLVKDNFTAFLRRNVMQYPESAQLPIHFTGSVAFHFRDTLEETASELGLQIGTIVQSPMEGLIRFHTDAR